MRASISLGLLALAAGLAWSGTGSGVERSRPPSPGVDRPSLRRAAATPSEARFVRPVGWHGGRLTASTGEQVTVEVSESYAPDAVPPQAWADFFAGLLHGEELGRVTVRVVTPAEIAALCGPGSLGCYGGGVLVMPGESFEGISPEEIARHEYGHHVAANRLNPPWPSVDYGPKRWASRVGVCAGTASGTFFPGDGGNGYRLNPGEGFAEAYRVLNERRGGATTLRWPIVDGVFLPGDEALAAIELDVVKPWTAPTVRTTRVRFRASGPRRWRLRLQTPLDGALTVSVRLPAGRLDDVELRDASGRTVLARGLWSSSTEKRLAYEICGRRVVELRVTRRGAAGSFTVVTARP